MRDRDAGDGGAVGDLAGSGVVDSEGVNVAAGETVDEVRGAGRGEGAVPGEAVGTRVGTGVDMGVGVTTGPESGITLGVALGVGRGSGRLKLSSPGMGPTTGGGAVAIKASAAGTIGQ